MNVFRIIGDALHQFSIIWLLLKLIRTKSCGGVSGKTQLLFAIVYTTRYLDLFTASISVYNSTVKIIYIICYYIIVLLIFVLFGKTYRRAEDTFMTELLLLPCFVLAILFSHDMTPIEILWTFSIYLEAVAILPQFYMIYRRGAVEKSLLYYLVPLGLYRFFYLFNWAYRYTSEGAFDRIAVAAGVAYVAIYLFALIEFCVVKIEVTDDGSGGKFLKSNIFFISNNEPYREVANEEKNAADVEPICGKV